MFVTQDASLARETFEQLTNNQSEDDYYILYSCSQDTDLETLIHYPSLDISMADLI